MVNKKHNLRLGIAAVCLLIASCKVPAIQEHNPDLNIPQGFAATISTSDTTSWASISWRQFFQDPHLAALIDTALMNNKELKITLQELEIAKSEAAFRRSRIFPTVGIAAGAAVEKVGRYTSQGAGDATTEIVPGKEMPDPLADFGIAATASWEVDIWHKLGDAQTAARDRYLASIEGKNFVLSNLIAELASSYYELLMFDNQLAIVETNSRLQEEALEVVKVQKQVGRVNELAVQKFKAELLKTQGTAYKIKQSITEAENRINFLLGRYPKTISRNSQALLVVLPKDIKLGMSAQLLQNRPDIKKAELELQASAFDVRVARAEFYPSLDISAALGLKAFKPSYLVKLPESMLYSLAGDMFAPLINKGAIKAEFNSANARQLQALYRYEQTVLNAYLEVSNQMSNINNLDEEVTKQNKQVEILNNSIEISKDLFVNSKAEYLEVLTTQRDVLEAKLDLFEMKKKQFDAMIKMYKALGGGWK